jgi:hypothetical protein
MIHGLSFGQALQSMMVLAILASAVMVFRPLLKGIGRAFLLVIRQRITARAELAARRSLHAQRALAPRG